MWSLLDRRLRLSRILRRAVVTGILVAPLTFLIACGGSDDDGESGQAADVDAANAAIEAGAMPATFEPPGPAFDVDPAVSGETIWFVANGLNFPFSQSLLQGIEDGAAVVGMNVRAVDGAGQPAKAANLIQQAISQDAAAIIILTFPTESVTEPIRAASDAGIPVIQINDHDPGLPPPEAQEAGVFANVSSCYGCGGEQLADLVVADSGGGAEVLFIDVPDINTTLDERDGFIDRMAEICPDCSVEVKSSPVGQWGGLETLTASALRENPNINYVVPAVDAMIAIIKPAIFATGSADRVGLASYNATKPVMEDIRAGGLVIGGVGNPEEWTGWAAVDQVLRALSDAEPVADSAIPNRIFTHENVQDLDLDAPHIEWYGEPGFREGYEELWRSS